MLRATLFVLRKDLKFMLRSRDTQLWVFVMPIIFFAFIGLVTGGMRGGGAPSLALRVGEGAGFLADQVRLKLEQEGFVLQEDLTGEQFAAAERRLWIPPAFTDSVLAGRQVALRYEHGQKGLGDDYESIRAGKAVYGVLADVIVASEGQGRVSPEIIRLLNEMPRTLQIEHEYTHIPSGFEQTIPGIMVMFVLLVLCTSGATLLVIERRQGLLRRLAYAPLPRLSVVLGKIGGKYALGLVQIAFAMLAGTYLPLFKMDWGPYLGGVILVMAVYGALMAALGMVLGNLARTEGLAVGIGVLSANVLGALGGCWWPIEVTAPWMQKLALFLPTGWAMHALHRLISFGLGPETIAVHVIGMGFGAVALVAVAVRTFRYE